MPFKKINKPVINYAPPDNLNVNKISSGNTLLITVINQTVPLSGLTNIGNGTPIFKQVSSQLGELRSVSGDSNINIYSGDTIGINLNDNININSISATTIYSGSTDLSLLITSGGGSALWNTINRETIQNTNVIQNPYFLGNYSLIFGINNTSNVYGNYSTILGSRNYIGSKYSFVNGDSNYIAPFMQRCVIHGGVNNRLTNYAAMYITNYQTILNGAFNKINSSENATIIGGRNNYINAWQYALNTYGLIIQGQNNGVFKGKSNSIINGITNKIGDNTGAQADAKYNTIINGSGNYIRPGTVYSTIIGGKNYTLSDSYTVLIPKLRIANLPSSTGSYMLVANAGGNVYKTSLPSGGPGSSTSLQPGINTFTGGTSINPTVNITGATLNNLTVTGNTSLSTLSASTIYSGSTNLSSLFATPSYVQNLKTSVQPGINTFTGGTSTNPTINVTGGSFHNIIASATVESNTFKLTTFDLVKPQIFADSDIDTGIMFDGPDILSLHTAGAQRLLINSSGNISNGNFNPAIGYNTHITGDTLLNSLVVSGSTFVVDTTTTIFQRPIVINSSTYPNLSNFNLNSGFNFVENQVNTLGILSAQTATTNYIKINTLSASTTNPERVLIYDVQPSSFSNVLVGIASAQTYAQLNIRNIHNGNQASSDIIATADNGSETSNYIDMGINSSTFSGYVGGANDGYLYSTGNDLWIGNVVSNKTIKLFTDGTGSTNVRLTISSASTNINNLSATTISANTIFVSGTNLSNYLHNNVDYYNAAGTITGNGGSFGQTAHRWYSNGVNAISITTVALTASSLKAVPLFISRAQIWDKIGFEITAGASGATNYLSAALYDSVNGFPTNKIYQFGTASTTSNARIIISGDTPTILPGLYFVAFNHSNVNSLTYRGYNTTTGAGVPLGFDNNNFATPVFSWSCTNTVSANLPSVFSGTTVATVANAPAIFYHIKNFV